MNNDLKGLLEAEYGFADASLSDAPRQFVAKTYFVGVEGEGRYFCKVVENPLFVPSIIAGLPALDELHRLGMRRINYPIRTAGGDFYVQWGAAIVVMYSRIKAPQSYDYDYFSLGQLLGEIHALTPQLQCELPREPITFEHRKLFEQQFNAALSGGDGSEFNRRLQGIVRSNETAVNGYYAYMNELSEEMVADEFDLVLTHGDAGGNVLMKTPTDLYIVDWDEILLAPKERDLWVLEGKPGFLEGYRSIFPEAKMDPRARKFCTLKYYFYSMLHYFSELYGDGPDHYRRGLLTDFEGFFSGWMEPYMKVL